MIGNEWLNRDEHHAAFKVASSAFVASGSADAVLGELENDAAYDAGFEAGVLASEAGLGRYDDRVPF